MKRILTIAFIVTAITLQAQHKETRKIAAPRAISVATSIETRYVYSSRNEVVVEVENPDHLTKLLTVVENGTLKIQYKPNSNIRTRTNSKVTVYSTGQLAGINVSSSGMLHLEDAMKLSQVNITVSSSGKLFAQEIAAREASVSVSSSGRVEGRITASQLNITGSSSGKLKLGGSAETASIHLSSSCTADLDRMTIKSASVQANSSATLVANVTDNLAGSVSSSGKIAHVGKPKHIQVSKSSGGQVIQR